MDKELLKTIIADQRTLGLPASYVSRALERDLRAQVKSNAIVIIAGVRRCGKSTLLHALRHTAKERDYYFNFDDERLVDFTVRDFRLLEEVFLELFGEQKTYYFDEIQNIKGWERFVRRLHDYGKKVYITGSNASMLSRELGTHLTGRFVQMTLYPFSFAEFLVLKGKSLKANGVLTTKERVALVRLFKEYMRVGGFPGYISERNGESFKALYESIVYRDIIARYNLSNERPIKELVYFCASNVGKMISFNALKDVIGVKGSTTVKEYFAYLENSFLTFLLPQFHHSLKTQLRSGKKIYFIDPAFAYHVGFRSSADRGRFLENIVFLQFLRAGSDCYFARTEKGECDFVVRTGGKITQAVQVCYTLTARNRDREINGLLGALEEYGLKKGAIVTLEESGEVKTGDKVIEIVPVWQWLL